MVRVFWGFRSLMIEMGFMNLHQPALSLAGCTAATQHYWLVVHTLGWGCRLCPTFYGYLVKIQPGKYLPGRLFLDFSSKCRA